MVAEHRLVDVLRNAGVPDLIEILADRLSPADLDAVLFETHRRRARRETPGDVFARYCNDPHVEPSATNATALALLDQLATQAAHSRFAPVAISPICPLGAISSLTTVDPGAAWGAAGRSEVVSDCRAVLALEAAARRHDAHQTEAACTVRLSTLHREMHLPFSAPLRSTGHSQVFALCTAGEASAEPLTFETTALVEQLSVHLGLLAAAPRAGLAIGLASVTLYHEAIRDLDETLRWDVVEPLTAAFPAVRILTEQERRVGRGFYAPVGFAITVEDRDEVEHRVALGGFTDWSQQLLDRPEELLLVSVMATEVLADVCAPGAGAST